MIIPAQYRNPFLKLVYIDLLELSETTKGVISSFVLENLILNKEYLEIFSLYYPKHKFSLDFVLSFFKQDLLKINKTLVKNKEYADLNLKTEQVGDFLFLPSVEYYRNQIITKNNLEVFYRNGIDPELFFKTALTNLSIKKKFVFEDLDVLIKQEKNERLKQVEKDLKISLDNNKDLEFQLLREQERAKEKQTKTNEATTQNQKNIKQVSKNIEDENLFYIQNNEEKLWLIDGHIIDGFNFIDYDTEKLFDKSKIKLKIENSQNAKEVKDFWYELKSYLQKEGKTEKEANALIAKLKKQYGIKNLLLAFKDFKNSKQNKTNNNLFVYLTWKLEEMKKNNNSNNLEEEKTLKVFQSF